MALGPGKYDAETTLMRQATEAEGILLIVLNGKHGTGFSSQLPGHALLQMPSVLRQVADEIERSGVFA